MAAVIHYTTWDRIYDYNPAAYCQTLGMSGARAKTSYLHGAAMTDSGSVSAGGKYTRVVSYESAALRSNCVYRAANGLILNSCMTVCRETQCGTIGYRGKWGGKDVYR